MKSAEQREVEFISALKKLLTEHGAELNVGDDGKSYGMHQGEVVISMDSIYRDDKLIADFCEFKLPGYMP